MARPRRPVHFGNTRKNDRKEWRGADNFTAAIAVGATVDQLLASAVVVATMTQPTLLTIRGDMFTTVVNNATNQGSIYFVGILVVPGGFSGAPEPQTSPELSWMYYKYGTVRSGTPFNSSWEGMERWHVHVKSKRVLDEGDSVHVFFHNDGPLVCDFGFGLRLLFGE